MVDKLIEQYIRLIALALKLGATEIEIEPAKAALRESGSTDQQINNAIAEAINRSPR